MNDTPKPKKQKISILCYFDWIDTLDSLSDKQSSDLMKHILKYGKSLYEGTEINPPSDPFVKLAFQTMKGQIDRDFQSWLNKCEQNKKNIMKRYNKKEDDSEFNPFNP